MLNKASTRVLLVDDSEMDHALTVDLLEDVPGRRYALDWKTSCDEGLKALVSHEYDVCLVDYSLGLKTGMDFLAAAQELQAKTPVIMLTGMEAREVDEQALAFGAADFFVKDGISSAILERPMRYAIERGRLLAELAHLAGHDSLTGLANRAHFYDFLAGAIAREPRNEQSVAVMLIDLDEFKHVNDSMGHAAGDQLLQCIAVRLQEVVRRGDLAARLGGDEFVVAPDNVTSDETAARIADKVITTLCQPTTLDGCTMRPCVSVGIARYHDSETTADSLIRAAVEVMYRAKAQPGAGFQVHTSNLGTRVRAVAGSGRR